MSVAEKICVFVFLLQGAYCTEYRVSLPEKIEALSGSCVIMKCTFEINEKDDQYLTESAATGLWLKDGADMNKYQVFNSRHPDPSHFNEEMTGKLYEKNCTTIFYDVSSNNSGKHYFRIMSDSLKFTYGQPFSTINVIDLNFSSVLIGAVVVPLVVIFCAVTCLSVRWLTMKEKAENEAADTYASLQFSAPPSE